MPLAQRLRLHKEITEANKDIRPKLEWKLSQYFGYLLVLLMFFNIVFMTNMLRFYIRVNLESG